MAHDIDQLKREIDELERQISSHPFEGLYDRKRMDQLQDKLKKRRKALARLEAGDEDEDGHNSHQMEMPDFDETDVVPQITHSEDVEEELPVRRTVTPIAAPKPKFQPAPAPKPKTKASAKAKPAAKKKSAKAKPKATAKARPAKKKAAKKPAKKKSKR